MIARLALVTAWLAVGHGAIAGLYWSLLQVPESNVWMLALSLGIVILTVYVAAVVEIGGSAAWTGESTRRAMATAVSAARRVLTPLAFVLGALVFAAIWWAVTRAAAWLDAHGGEIDAWLMVTFGWARTEPLFTATQWLLVFLRAIVGPTLGLALAFAVARLGLRDAWRTRWLRAGLSPRQLALVTLWMLAFVALPWRAVVWRPRGLPPTWMEAMFVTVKLAAMFLLANIGWALVIRTITNRLSAGASLAVDTEAAENRRTQNPGTLEP